MYLEKNLLVLYFPVSLSIKFQVLPNEFLNFISIYYNVSIFIPSFINLGLLFLLGNGAKGLSILFILEDQLFNCFSVLLHFHFITFFFFFALIQSHVFWFGGSQFLILQWLKVYKTHLRAIFWGSWFRTE